MASSIRNWGPDLTPLSGTLRLYVDGTAGSDAAAGTSWATAWKTWNRTREAVAAILFLQPDGLDLAVFVRGAFTEAIQAAFHLQGTSRVHVVHHIDDFTTIRTGTVSAVGGEAPAPKHGMERLTLAGAALDGTEVGMTVVLIDPVSGSRATCTVVRVNVASQYVWTTQLIGEFPAWVAASPANVTIRRPSMSTTLSVELNFYEASYAGPSALYPCNSVIGMRADQDIAVSGAQVCVAGCYARSAAGTWKNLRVSGLGGTINVVQYYRYSGFYLSDALAAEFGLIGGATPTTYNVLGNAGGRFYPMSGQRIAAGSGYFDGAFECSFASDVACVRFSAGYIYCAGVGPTVSNFIVRGTSSSYGAIHSHSGDIKATKFSLLDLPAAGCPAFFWTSRAEASIDVTDANFEGDNTGNGSDRKLAYAQGGEIIFRSGIPDGVKAKHRQLVTEEDGLITLRGDWTMTAARAGSGVDVDAGDGLIYFGGHVVKSAVNTLPTTMLLARRGARVTQATGKNFTLPAGTGNNVTDYGADGPIVAKDGLADLRLGNLTGGQAGVTTGPGATLRNVARLVHAGVGLSGTAPLVLGGLPASPWPAAALTDAGAVVPEGCVCIPGVT